MQPNALLTYKHKSRIKHFAIGKKTVLQTLAYAASAAAIVFGVMLLDRVTDNKQAGNATAVNEPAKHNIIKEAAKTVHQENPAISQPTAPRAQAINKPTNLAQETYAQETIELSKIEAKAISSIIDAMPQGPMLAKTLNMPEKFSTKATQSAVNVAKAQMAPETEAIAASRGINLWAIAEMGLRLFSRLNETNIDLQPSYTRSGEIKSVTFITKQRVITAPVI
ncbi:MAG: hypothetical protein HC896_11880 [Bacteroidales bacterium]|nr:hypothetical protein [Bacteroidales bacterium]